MRIGLYATLNATLQLNCSVYEAPAGGQCQPVVCDPCADANPTGNTGVYIQLLHWCLCPNSTKVFCSCVLPLYSVYLSTGSGAKPPNASNSQMQRLRGVMHCSTHALYHAEKASWDWIISM